MSSNHIIVDLTKYYEEYLCPNCSRDVNNNINVDDENKEVEKCYNEYLANCDIRFGLKSLPLCRNCFANTDGCYICKLPYSLETESISILLTHQTTTISADLQKYDICSRCSVNNPDYVYSEENDEEFSENE